MKRAIVASVFIASLALLPMELAYAAKGGNGHANGQNGGTKNATSSATLTSSCDYSDCFAGVTVDFAAEGLDGSQLTVMIDLGNDRWGGTGVREDGTTEFHYAYKNPGMYTVRLYQDGKGNKLELKAELVVDIQ